MFHLVRELGKAEALKVYVMPREELKQTTPNTYFGGQEKKGDPVAGSFPTYVEWSERWQVIRTKHQKPRKELRAWGKETLLNATEIQK